MPSNILLSLAVHRGLSSRNKTQDSGFCHLPYHRKLLRMEKTSHLSLRTQLRVNAHISTAGASLIQMFGNIAVLNFSFTFLFGFWNICMCVMRCLKMEVYIELCIFYV